VATLPQLSEKYPIVGIEDGRAEDDWTGWKQLTSFSAIAFKLVGDDLFVRQQGPAARASSRRSPTPS